MAMGNSYILNLESVAFLTVMAEGNSITVTVLVMRNMYFLQCTGCESINFLDGSGKSRIMF